MFQPGMEPGARAAVEQEALPSSPHSARERAVAPHTQSPACRCRGESWGPDSRDHAPADPADCPPACASPPEKWATPRVSLSPWWRSLLPAAQPNPDPTQQAQSAEAKPSRSLPPVSHLAMGTDGTLRGAFPPTFSSPNSLCL